MSAGPMRRKRPVEVQNLRSLLGAINFYRRFLPHAAEIELPLKR